MPKHLPDWNTVDTVLLDMDGTLLDLNFDNHFWQEFVPLKYAQLHNLSLVQAKINLAPQFKAMEGRIEWYCLDYWSEALRLDIQGLKTELAGLIAILPHAIEFMEKLRKTTRKVYLVTNAHRDSLDLKMEKTCLNHFFDGLYSAHDFGVAKENSAFWPQLAEHLAFNKQHTLMVDDSLAVLNSAKAFGIAHLVTMRQPDSQRPARIIQEYPSISDFRELLPGL